MYVIFFTFSYLHGCAIVDSPRILHYDIKDKLPRSLEWECGIETWNDDMVWNGDAAYLIFRFWNLKSLLLEETESAHWFAVHKSL